MAYVTCSYQALSDNMLSETETYNQRACCPAGAIFSERSLGKSLVP